jgi:hypothetical protein
MKATYIAANHSICQAELHLMRCKHRMRQLERGGTAMDENAVLAHLARVQAHIQLAMQDLTVEKP